MNAPPDIASRLLSAERDNFHLILTAISSDGNGDGLPLANGEAKDSHSRFPGTLLLVIGGAGLELRAHSGLHALNHSSGLHWPRRRGVPVCGVSSQDRLVEPYVHDEKNYSLVCEC